MHHLWKMKYYFALAISCASLPFVLTKSEFQLRESEITTQLDVGSVRQNPGSYRSFFYPITIFSGGK